MDEKTRQTLPSLPVAEQAAVWCMEFDEGDPGEHCRREFVAWLKESPTHIEEFLQISALQLMIAESPEKVATIEALTAWAQHNVVALDNLEPDDQPPKPVPRRRHGLVAAVGAVAVAVAVLLAVLTPGQATVQHYQTGFGEQRSIVLPDDSMVVLNTQSSITIEYSPHGRHAKLHSGEVLFDIADNPARPFTVDANNLAIRVLGTTFNVYRQQQQTVVTVVEGEVRVDPNPNTIAANDKAPLPAEHEDSNANRPMLPVLNQPLQLHAGEQLSVANTGSIAREPQVNLDQAIAWTDRRLVFDNDPLSAVFEQFNRYNRRALVLDAPALANRKITGVFAARDIDTLLKFVEAQPGVKTVRSANEIRITESR